jgi:hypothetical protein
VAFLTCAAVLFDFLKDFSEAMLRILVPPWLLLSAFAFGRSSPSAKTQRAMHFAEKPAPHVESNFPAGKRDSVRVKQEDAQGFRPVVEAQDRSGDAKPPLQGKPPAPKDAIVPEPLSTKRPDPPNAVYLSEVVASVHGSFPLIDAAIQEATIANGNLLAAWGEFDLKLKAQSENGPTGFY